VDDGRIYITTRLGAGCDRISMLVVPVEADLYVDDCLVIPESVKQDRAGRRVTVLSVGDVDWNPTAEDLQRVVQAFHAAAVDEAGAVLAVPYNVRARTLSGAEVDELMALPGQCLTAVDIAYCLDAADRARNCISIDREERVAAGVKAFREAADRRLAGD
jgi:hypothetical protein